MGYMCLCALTVKGSRKVINCQTRRKPFTTRLIYHRGSMASVVEFRSKSCMALQEERTIQSFTCSGQSRRNDYRKLHRLALKCKSAAEAIFFCYENVHLSMYTETFFKGHGWNKTNGEHLWTFSFSWVGNKSCRRNLSLCYTSV